MNFDDGYWPGPGDFCALQPFCQMDPSEPLKETLLTMMKRKDHANRGFFRPGATFVPVIVSAHDEHDFGGTRPHVTQPEEVVNYFQRNMTDLAGLQAYSFIIKPQDYKCLREYSSIFERGDGGVYGKSLDRFATMTGGTSTSLCEKDYGKALANLSQSVRQQISSITLQQAPFGNSLSITFQPAAPGISWIVQGKNVIFNQPLPAGTTLNISYLYSPN